MKILVDEQNEPHWTKTEEFKELRKRLDAVEARNGSTYFVSAVTLDGYRSVVEAIENDNRI